MTRCTRCTRPQWPSTPDGAALCWGGAQCDAGRLALLERALRAAVPFLPVEHPAVALTASATPHPPDVAATVKAATEAAHRRILVEFPTGAEADRVRVALTRHGYDPEKPSSLARALLAALGA